MILRCRLCFDISSTLLAFLLPRFLAADSTHAAASPPQTIFSVSPVYPSLCTSATVAYTSSKSMPTGKFVIGGKWGDPGAIWTFSANNNVVFGHWGAGGRDISSQFKTNQDGSVRYTIASGAGGASITGSAGLARSSTVRQSFCGSSTVLSASSVATRKPSSVSASKSSPSSTLESSSGSTLKPSTGSAVESNTSPPPGACHDAYCVFTQWAAWYPDPTSYMPSSIASGTLSSAISYTLNSISNSIPSGTNSYALSTMDSYILSTTNSYTPSSIPSNTPSSILSIIPSSIPTSIPTSILTSKATSIITSKPTSQASTTKPTSEAKPAIAKRYASRKSPRAILGRRQAEETAYVETSAPAVPFTLTVTGQIPCDEQVVDFCNDTSTPSLTVEQWEAWHVDEFWESWVAKNSPYYTSNQNMLQLFFTEFTGGHSDQTNVTGYNCAIDDEQNCHPLSSCADYKSNTSPGNTIQAYYVWNALVNLSQTLNFVWLAIQGARILWSNIDVALGSTFADPPPTGSWNQIFQVANGAITLCAVLFIALDISATYIAVAIFIGLATFLSLVANIFTASNANSQPSWQVVQITKDQLAITQFFDSFEKPLITIHNEWMNDGKNITELLKGGIWLQAGAALSDVKPLLAHGPQKASDLAQSGALKNASTYFNNLVATNLINNYFREAGAHIVFIPYGQVLSLDWKQKWISFTEADCHDNYVDKGPRTKVNVPWKNGVIAKCYPDGMATFMTPGKTVQPIAWFEKSNFTYDDFNNVSFSPFDMMDSSVSGFLNHGFNYNYTQDLSNQLTAPSFNPGTLAQLVNVDPNHAGVYNIPVCYIADLSAVPNCVSTTDDALGSGCQLAPCTCGGDNVTDAIAKPPKITRFRDVVAEVVTKAYNDTITAQFLPLDKWNCALKGHDGSSFDISPPRKRADKGLPLDIVEIIS